jgi:photosystem II stability/assembly factor-like uncharacterized protein
MCMVGTSPSGPYRQLLLTTTDGGIHWSEHRMPAYVGQVICFDTSTCFGFGTTGSSSDDGIFLRTDDGGAHWTEHVLVVKPMRGLWPSSAPDSFTCPTEKSCVGITSYAPRTTRGIYGRGSSTLVWHTGNGGATWSHTLLSASLGQPSCWNASRCIATDNPEPALPNPALLSGSIAKVLETSDGGASWSVHRIVGKRLSFIQALVCRAPDECLAAGFSLTAGTAVVASDDGGVTWANEEVPSDAANFTDLDCPSSTVCFGIGRASTADNPTGVTEVFTNSPSGQS